MYVREKLKRFSGISAVKSHIQSCIPIYTVLLLMDYAVKAVVGSFRELGKVVRLIRNKSLLGDSSWNFANNRELLALCWSAKCHVSTLSGCLQDDFHRPVCLQGSTIA